jgi:hypothetical protein
MDLDIALGDLRGIFPGFHVRVFLPWLFVMCCVPRMLLSNIALNYLSSGTAFYLELR